MSADQNIDPGKLGQIVGAAASEISTTMSRAALASALVAQFAIFHATLNALHSAGLLSGEELVETCNRASQLIRQDQNDPDVAMVRPLEDVLSAFAAMLIEQGRCFELVAAPAAGPTQ